MNGTNLFIEHCENTPLISVALCTYNGATFLATQLDSVLAQNWPNFEIVIVDDASSDETREILMHYEARDPRIHLHFNRENLGFLANFQKALSLTKGDYIAPCDQDDWWDPDKLTGLYEVMEGNGMAYCNSLLVNAEGESLNTRVSDVMNMYSGHDPTAFVFANSASGHAQLIRRSVVLRAMPFPKECFHDWWLAFVAASTEGLTYLPEVLVHYRQHAATQTDIGKKKARKQMPGFRAGEFQGRQKWFEALASFPGREQSFFIELSQAHGDWLKSWTCPHFVNLLLQRRSSLFAIRRRTAKTPFAQALRFFFGLRARQFILPRRYGTPSV